jgi:hypothetical protein
MVECWSNGVLKRCYNHSIPINHYSITPERIGQTLTSAWQVRIFGASEFSAG